MSRDQQILQVRILNLFKRGFEEEKEELRGLFRKICMFIQTDVAPGPVDLKDEAVLYKLN